MIKSLLILILFFISANLLFSYTIISTDTSKRYYIKDIKLIGNKITEDFVIYREMKIKPGMSVTQEELNFDKARIYSLGIFSTVDFQLENFEDGYILIVDLMEAWYIWPNVILDRKEKDWKKLSYGLGLKIQNFRGRNETVFLEGTLGYDPTIRLSYRIPHFYTDLDLYFLSGFEFTKRKNKSRKNLINNENYDENVFEANFVIGKRFGYFDYLNLNISYFYLKIPQYYYGRTISTTGIDTKISVGVAYIHDSRDLVQYPSKGEVLSLQYTKHGLSTSIIDYSVIDYDFRYYYLLKPFIFAFRNALRSAFGGEIPNYANSFIGYGERVRGHFFDFYEGQSMIISNAEIKFPFVKDWILSFDFPIIPKSLQTANILIDVHLFADAGVVWEHKENLLNKPLIKGYGVGMTLGVLPFSSARFEVGFDEKFTPQFLIDLHAAF